MRILFIDTIHPILKQELEKKGHICDTAYEESKTEIQKTIYNYQGIVIRSRFKIDKKFIDSATNLEFIARAGSGLDNIDVNYSEKRSINCYNAAEGNRQAVAEHALGILLSLFNNLKNSDPRSDFFILNFPLQNDREYRSSSIYFSSISSCMI